jgi:hypothetical protein
VHVATTRVEAEEKKWGSWGRLDTELWRRGMVSIRSVRGAQGGHSCCKRRRGPACGAQRGVNGLRMVGAGVPVGGEEGRVGRSGWLWAGLVRKSGSGPTQERNSIALYLFKIYLNEFDQKMAFLKWKKFK